MNARRVVAAALVLACCWAPSLNAAGKKKEKPPKPAIAADSYEELYERYLAAARTMPAAPQGTGASTATPFFNTLMLDLRARSVNDILTVRVSENIVGSGTADSNLSKNSNASASMPGFFGLEKKLPGFLDPTNLASTTSDSKFKGAGSTSRASQLTAMMSARVAEVLPNGDLVLEGIREIDINGDRQIIVLTGTVRPTDVTRANAVLSSQIAQLRIRYYGRGLIKDNLKPGWLIRALNKIF